MHASVPDTLPTRGRDMSCTMMTISNLDDTLHQILLPLVGRR
jgi:hypothetical protein